MGHRERDRCVERIERLSRGSLSPEEVCRAAIEELHRAVGFERWCWPLMDPESALAMSGIGEVDFWPSLGRLVALEEHGDVTSKPELVLGRRATSTLNGATRGDLSRSIRWRECMQPYGIGDELMAVCRDRHGCWGSVELLRGRSEAPFGEDDVRLLERLAPTLGTLLRRVQSGSWQGDVAGLAPCVSASGTLILDAALKPVGWTPEFKSWLGASASTDAALSEMLPPAIYELGARALAPVDSAAAGLPNRLRVPTPSGRWLVLEGSLLEGGDHARVAITVRAATSEEVFDLLGKSHDLTRRERELTRLLLRGMATNDVADELGISSYTVQDHLKAIFRKTGARNRSEMLSRLTGRADAWS